ncbi:Flagellar motor switch protein FliN [Halobacillus karajensis]|uniref:Flagellar motor switch protein FliN n=2 Tax=Halobacillus karajensis TaxID=195088 RepID=A0A024P1L6_9BACI|nr:Flagellar motor switch protein FliN [Halobacillus karajensis]CDQ22194.1 Flagellar motor switch protein FliN [Halobacillus karajensis]CDQ28035.1 Flagellar motor switch protein FliN [Halobacillus karajensis]
MPEKMRDDMLSQDEIDALLNGGEDISEEALNGADMEDHLSSVEEDALGEIGNISFGSSATALSSLLNQKVEITTPQICVVSRADLPREFPKPHVAIGVTYTDGFSGENVLVIGTKDAAIIADLMLGGDGMVPEDHLNEIALSAVQEAMNQMMGSAATSMSTIFNKKVDISPPAIDVLDLEEEEDQNKIPDEEVLVKVSFQLQVGTLIDSNIMQLIPISFAKELVEELITPEREEVEALSWLYEKETKKDTEKQLDGRPAEKSTSELESPKPPNPTKASSSQQYVGGPAGQTVEDANVQAAEFQSFNPVQLSGTEQKNLDMLMDIPLKVTVELGRTKRTVREILELTSGSVLELDKLAGEPVDIHVNEKLMAKGEVVVIDENFGVRVTDIVSPKERLTKLR